MRSHAGVLRTDFRGQAALMPRGPTVISVGIPKGASFWDGCRDFLGFLDSGVLVETGKAKCLRRQNPVQHLGAGRMSLTDSARILSNPDVLPIPNAFRIFEERG